MKRIATLVVAVLATTLLASSLASCGSTGSAGAGAVVAVTTPTPIPTVTPTIDRAALDALVAARNKQFVKASNAFRKCDRNITTDSYAAYACLDEAAAVAGVVQGLLADVEDVVTPSDFASTKSDLKALVQRANYVAKVCASQADQKCDQALASFRAADQSVHWSLSSP